MPAPTQVWMKAQSRSETTGKPQTVIEQRRPWKNLRWRIVEGTEPVLRQHEVCLGYVGSDGVHQ